MMMTMMTIQGIARPYVWFAVLLEVLLSIRTYVPLCLGFWRWNSLVKMLKDGGPR